MLGVVVLVLTALLSAFSCAVEPEEVESTSTAIRGGANATSCQWPSAVMMGDYCSGALIHPELVVHSAHCGSFGFVRFGENKTAGFTVRTTSCVRHPSFTGSGPWDFGICRLERPVTEVPIVPPLMGCELSAIVAGAPVVAAGWGFSGNRSGLGVKRWVEMVIAATPSVTRNVTVRLTARDRTRIICGGDSGGPSFIQLTNGSWRQFSLHRTGARDCNRWYTTYDDQMLHRAIPWIEMETGLDVTPCHDADGTWNPGPDCNGFPMDPGTGVGAWPTCGTGVVSGPSMTCGDAWVPPPVPDAGPPPVPDAGPPPVPDAGPPPVPDAGPPPVPDAGPPPVPDAGPPPVPDAGPPPVPDAGVVRDGGTGALTVEFDAQGFALGPASPGLPRSQRRSPPSTDDTRYSEYNPSNLGETDVLSGGCSSAVSRPSSCMAFWLVACMLLRCRRTS